MLPTNFFKNLGLAGGIFATNRLKCLFRISNEKLRKRIVCFYDYNSLELIGRILSMQSELLPIFKAWRSLFVRQ